MDKTAAHYYKTAKAARQDTKPPVATPPCADPGAFVYTPAAPRLPLRHPPWQRLLPGSGSAGQEVLRLSATVVMGSGLTAPAHFVVVCRHVKAFLAHPDPGQRAFDA